MTIASENEISILEFLLILNKNSENKNIEEGTNFFKRLQQYNNKTTTTVMVAIGKTTVDKTH